MRASLTALSEKDLAFVAAHATYELESNEPHDSELAQRLGVTRQTILNRRRRLRSKGVPLYPFRGRGYQAKADPRQGNLFN